MAALIKIVINIDEFHKLGTNKTLVPLYNGVLNIAYQQIQRFEGHTMKPTQFSDGRIIG